MIARARENRARALVLLLAFAFVGILLTSQPTSVSAAPPSAGTVSASPNPVTIGQATTISTTGSSRGSAPSTYAWTGLPPGCSSSNSTSISCTPTGASGSPFTVTLTITDSTMATSMASTPLNVNKFQSTMAIGCAPSPTPVGSPSTCTANVGGYGTPGGTVTFTQGGGTATTSLTTSTSCTLSSGTCQVTASTTGAGGANIGAVYSGDGNNLGTSAATTLSVSPIASTTSVICSPASLVVGQMSTCTAIVTGYSPTGIISWSSSDRAGIFSANPCSLSSAACGVTYTPTASATITALYSGDQNNIGGSGTFSITASVNELLQIAVANSGPATTVTLSGCSVSPTSIPADGLPHSFQASSGCSPITVTLPPATTNTRYATSGGGNSFTIGSCSSTSCQTFSATIYFQVQNGYQATPKNPSSWSSAGSIAVNGTSLGTPGQNVCSIVVSTGAGSFSCQGWTDYNTPAIMGVLPISQNQRWAPSQNSFADTTGGNQHNSNYFSQVLESFQYSLVGSSTAPTAPRLNFTTFGATNTVPLIGSASSVWIDSGSSWSVPAALAGSSSSERWDSLVSSGAATAGQTVSLVYYHQFSVNFGFSIIGGGNAFSTPSVSYTAFGVPASALQTWVDAGSSYAYSNPLQGSTAVERWFTATPVGTISGSGTVVAFYYHQYAFALSFDVKGGGVYNNPRINFTTLGNTGLAQVNTTQATYWADSGTKWNVTPLLPSSSSTERWITQQVSSGTAAAPLQTQFLYYHQYLGTLLYSIKGTGGSPPVPSVNYTTFGASLVTPLPTAPGPFWMDSATAWHVPLLLPGGQGERWLSNVTSVLVASAPFQVDAQYAHQFFVEVGVSTAAGGAVANTNQWRDQGSSVILNATASHLWSFAYWKGFTPFSYNGTTLLANLQVTGPANETAIFFPGLTISTDSGGSVNYQYGTIKGTVPSGSNATVYLRPNQNITLTAVPSTVEIQFQGWTGGLSNQQLPVALSLGAPGKSPLQADFGIISPGYIHATFATDYNDIRVFAVAAIGVFIAACYIFIIRRGFAPKIGKKL